MAGAVQAEGAVNDEMTKEGEKAESGNGRLASAKPFLPGDASLTQQTDQETGPDVTGVGIGDDQSQVAAAHLGMASASEGAFKAQLPEPLDEFLPGDGRELRHVPRLQSG